MITVQLLGGASLRDGDVPLNGPPVQRHRIALLALIVSAWPQPITRDRAMALLWPERDQANSRRLLNLAVHVLRAALGEGAIASTGDALLFNPAHLHCDLHDLRAALAAGEPDEVARLHAGVLLDGFHLPDSAEFGYWLDQQRSELAHAFAGALLALAERQERAGDVHGRVGSCLRLVAADPHSGTYARLLMRALDAAGDRAGAIQQAADHARRLRADLEMDPDPEVAALAEELRRAPPPRAPEPRGPAKASAHASARTRSVAVLPFASLGGDTEHDYFADGITEDVIAHLSKIRSLHVISRASVMPLRPGEQSLRERSLREIGRALGAATLLDGSVRHAGDRVRIVASLVDVETERHLWAETYDRQLTDIFAIQTDVALQIAAALEAELSPAEETRVRKQPTADFQAYRLYLQGRRRFTRYTPDASARAIRYFELAIERDPGFALAWANLATTCTDLAEIGALEPEAAYARAAEAAATALRLDPELGEAHTTMGYLKTVRDFDWAGAEAEFRRAIELNPGDPDSYNLYGRLCAGLGRYDEAVVMLQRAQELDPLAHRVDVATALLRAGRYEQALARAEEAVELDASQDRAQATVGWAHFLIGRQEEGILELEQAVLVSRRNTLWLGQLGEAYAMAGQTDKARAVLAELHQRAETSYVSPYHFAYVHTGLGETEVALDWLERAVAERTGPVYGIRTSFLLAPLREHPRFQALLRHMNLQ